MIYSVLYQCLDGVVVSILAFQSGAQTSILLVEQHISNFSFSQSDPSGVTKNSSLKLATSGITSPSKEKGES